MKAELRMGRSNKVLNSTPTLYQNYSFCALFCECVSASACTREWEGCSHTGRSSELMHLIFLAGGD